VVHHHGVKVVAAVAAVAAMALIATNPRAPLAGARVNPAAVARAPQAGKIKHVVVIMQENRSFDEVLGYWCTHPVHHCNGYVGPVHLQGGGVATMTQSPDVITNDPPHSVIAQTTAIDGGKMDGWKNLGTTCHSPGRNDCLTYYKPSQIPALTALASRYAVSDHTFTAQDSPSWGGHMWDATATQDGFTGDIPYNAYGKPSWGCDADLYADWISSSGVKSLQPSCIPAPAGLLSPSKYPYRGAFAPTKVANVPTIFDRLDQKHLPWRIYETIDTWSPCPTFAECLYGPQRHNEVSTGTVLGDAKNGKLPAYSVVVPDGPGGGTGQHAPSSMLVGDNWLGKLVTALQKSPDWSSTAIFITYDDCGCYYDHVAPGRNPDGTEQGLRVPMVIISPYAKRDGVDSTPATFASFLRFTEEAFGLAPLTVNDAKAYDYRNAFNFSAPPTAPRVWPRQQPVPKGTQALVASLPPVADDPT
jgi:phospholipase C